MAATTSIMLGSLDYSVYSAYWVTGHCPMCNQALPRWVSFPFWLTNLRALLFDGLVAVIPTDETA